MTTGYARSFKDLRVYQEAREVSRAVFNLSKAFPKDEMYSLTDQVRRAARSIGAQIAEAWGKRRYAKHFVSKLTDADAEQMETQHRIGEAFDCGYISEADARRLSSGLEGVGRMLHSMMEKADSFCGPPDGLLREPEAEYFSAPTTDD
ncbi:MAG TPA: four helix bundle protein [Chthoniobacterales bacterium]|nr:four helix bundle protein [Chthoniobacterales bacterium]